MPPHIFLLAAVGVSLVAGYRLAHWSLKKHRSETDADEAAHDTENSKEPRNLGTLIWDEASGSYKPRQQ